MSKTVSFEESFKDFVSKRLNEDLNSLESQSPELQEMNNKLEKQQKIILNTFSKTDEETFKERLDKYISIHYMISGTIAEISYFQGMKDAYSLIKMLEGTIESLERDC